MARSPVISRNRFPHIASSRTIQPVTSGTLSAEPPSDHGDVWLYRFAAMSLIFVGFIAFVWMLYVARPVLVPIAAAIIFGLVLAPLGEKLQQLGIPSMAANAVIITNVFAAIYIVIRLTSPHFEDIIATMPAQMDAIGKKLSVIIDPLETLQNHLSTATGSSDPSPAKRANPDIKAAAVYVFSSITPAITQIGIFFIFLILFLLDRSVIKRSLVLGFEAREDRLEALKTINQIEKGLGVYLSTVILINLGVAAATMLALYLAGMKSYILLGIVAFLVNFLPFAGPLAMKLFLLLLGLVTYQSWLQGLMPAILYTIIVVIESNFITPLIVGKRFTVRPIIVFGSIVFWTWLWGLSGGLLAMPITVIASSILDRFFGEDKIDLP